MLSWEEEKNLLALIPECTKAMGQLIVHHLPLIKKWAFLLSHDPYEREELVSEGIIAFIEAVKNFQTIHNVRLSSYAKKWIIFAMRKFKEKTSSWVDVSDLDIGDPSSYEKIWVDEVHQEHQAALVHEALDGLSPEEINIVRHRILEEERTALKDLAAERGCSLERIRQIEESILIKIKRRLLVLQHT